MNTRIQSEINLDQYRKNLLEYTRRAFEMIPKQEQPMILDIGCGTGVPTIELARLSDGMITGIDVDEESLKILDLKIEKLGWSERIRTMRLSMSEMDLPEESYDIVWAEGVVHIIDFERGLREFSRVLKPGGYLVIHDELRGHQSKLDLMDKCGFRLIGSIIISQDIWEERYVRPMKEQFERVCARYEFDVNSTDECIRCKKELADYERNPEGWQSIFYVMQKMEV